MPAAPAPPPSSLQADTAAEYAAAAASYDRRWADYNRATAGRTRAALVGLVGEDPGGPILEVGCGTGVLLATLPGAVRVGVDLTPAMLRVARGRTSEADRASGGKTRTVPAAGTAGRLPVAGGAFAGAAANSALHYLDDPAAGVRELARAVRPGGAVVVTDWRRDDWFVRLVLSWLKLTGRPVGRVFTAAQTAAALEAAGLVDVEVTCWKAGRWGMTTATGRTPAG